MIVKIIRKQKPYAQIHNDLLRDKRLSFKARGILCYLISQPDNWIPRVADLVNQGQEGKSAVLAAMQELKRAGYARMAHDYDHTNKKLRGRHWVVFESPEEQSVEKPVKQKTLPTGNRTHKNTEEERITNAAPAGAGRCSFELAPVAPPNKLVEAFANWSIKNRFHLLQRGSTKTGWKPSTIKQWNKHANELVSVVGAQEVKEVWRWFKEHHKDDFVPQCRTLKSFCEKFTKLQDAKRRQLGSAQSGEHTEHEVEHEFVPREEVYRRLHDTPPPSTLHPEFEEDLRPIA